MVPSIWPPKGAPKHYASFINLNTFMIKKIDTFHAQTSHCMRAATCAGVEMYGGAASGPNAY